MTDYRVGIYIRLSLADGDGKAESDSIGNQRELIHQFLDRHPQLKTAPRTEFVDDGYTGTNTDRPQFQALMKELRTGAINVMVMKDFSRCHRDYTQMGNYLECVFPFLGVRYLSVNDGYDKYVKFRRGEYQSKLCPYGYQKGADGRMEPNEETAPNVRMIFELARDGRKPNEIVKALFERNIPTPAEYKAAHGFNGHDISRCCGIWSTSSVVHILDDERYTGTYIIGKREVTEVGGHRVRMKDESQWVKIPDHHQAIISRELFDQVQAQRPRFKCPKKKARAYPLRSKVFCGCCGHAMPRRATKNATFFCRYTLVNEAADCHGLTVTEAELEGMLYEILSKQAQIILNVANLANAGRLDVQLARQAEYDKRIEGCLDQKRVLYEQLILKQITMEDYKSQKAAVDSELDRLREIHSDLKVRTSQMEMDEKAKSARTELAWEVVGAGGLTAGLADTLIDRVYVYPNNQVEIVWKIKDFCME